MEVILNGDSTDATGCTPPGPHTEYPMMVDNLQDILHLKSQ